MRAYFYNFAKKVNSTAIPAGSGPEFEVKLKSPCGILQPVLELSTPIVKDYNYVYIPEFDRFYFITSVGYSGGLWHVSCEVDVLASYRNIIFEQQEYVLRSASESNGDVVDGMYPVTTNIVETVAASSGSNYTMAGVFCLGVAGSGSALGVSYYLMTPSNFKDFVTELMSNTMADGFNFSFTDSEGITALSDGLVKSLLNPMQYIKSCYFLPVNQNLLMRLGTGVTGIKVGPWNALSAQARLIEGVAIAIDDAKSITIPKHPQSSRGNYLNGSPYSNYRLLLEPFGFFEIPATDLLKANTLYYGLAFDIVTGMCDLDIALDAGLEQYYIAHKTAQLGIPIALTQITQNILGGVAGVGAQVVGGITNAVAGNYIGLAGNVAAAIMDAVAGLLPTVTSSGTTGSFLVLAHSAKLHARFALIADEDNTHNGRPLCKEKRIGDLSGLVICDKPTLAIPSALKDEVIKISNFMERGFFVE